MDVDGDTCHHAHIAAKAFCEPFGNHVERLLTDLHTDCKWSTHNRDLFADICLALEILPSSPKNYVPHRWLCIVEVVADTLRIFDALIVFYFSFLETTDQDLYKIYVSQIFQSRIVSQQTQLAIRKIQLEAKTTMKSATKDGQERKKRIIEKLFVHHDKTLLQLHIYISVLSTLFGYIKVFQCQAPMMHELHTKQEELLKEYLQCFVRPEKLAGGSTKDA